MKKNIGGRDRLVRAVLGTALFYYALSNLPGSDVWRVPAGIAGGSNVVNRVNELVPTL